MCDVYWKGTLGPLSLFCLFPLGSDINGDFAMCSHCCCCLANGSKIVRLPGHEPIPLKP